MICLFATSATIAQDGGWEWLLAAGRNNNDWSNSLVKDADDNLYITGAFTHTAIFGKDTLGNTVTLTSLPSTLERFVAKYNKRGECLWVKSVYRITANNSNRKGSIAIDTLGNLFVGGTAYGDVINGTDTLFKYERGVHAFISSFSSEDGSSKWIRMSGSNAFRTNLSGDTLGIHDAYCFSVEADNQGGVYTTGMFNNEMFIDTSANGSTYVEGGAITSYAVFLLKYDSIGNLLWNSFIKPQNNNWSIFSNAVRINSTGDVFIAGTTYDRQFVYDATNQLVDSMYTNPYATVTNIYILQFNQNGEYIRQNLYERNNRQYSNSMFIDQEDNIFLCGRFLSSLSFNEDTVTALKGLYDVFILKITPDSIGTDGNFNIVWANYILGIGGSQSETTGNIIANDNFVYLTGYFTDTTYFTPTDFAINDSLRDIYIAKYDKGNGTFQFALQAGGTLYDEGWGIAVDDCENIYATGYFTSPAYFEDDTLTGSSYREIFLGKYNVHYTDFIPDILICPNTQITITATNLAPSQYVLSWSNTVTLIDSITVSPTTTTTYTLTVSDTEGCTASDQAIITVREVTTLTWEGDTTNQFGEITTTSYSHDQTPNPPAIAVPLNPDNDWFIATNWTCDILPDSTWDVIIPSNPIGGDTVFPVIDRSGGTSTFIAKCKNKSFKVGFTAHKEGIYKIRRRRLENYTNVTLQVIDHLTNDTSYLYKDKEYIAFHYDSIIERRFTINIVEDTGNNEPIYYASDTINDNSKSKENYQKLLNPILRCYPNPTNQAINIEYELASSSSNLDKRFDVSLKVYNSYGTLIQEIVNEKQNVGKKLYTFDLPNNGMYIARLIIDNKTFKQIIIKQ